MAMKNRPMRRNPSGRRRPLSEAAIDDSMYHGGVIKTAGPYGDSDPEPGAQAFTESIERGLEALATGTSEFAPDVEAVPDAPVEVFDLFDIETGEHVMIWRVACRERSKHAN